MNDLGVKQWVGDQSLGYIICGNAALVELEGSPVVVPAGYVKELIKEAYRNRNINIDQIYTDLDQITGEVGELYKQLRELLKEIE